jgi:hypothetical protein
LTSSTEVLWLANKRVNDAIFREYYWHNYAQKRIENKVATKLLIEPTARSDWDTDINVWRETRRHPLIKNTPSSFVLFEDKVIIYTPSKDEPYGVFIQNQSVKDLFEKIFVNLWKQAK